MPLRARVASWVVLAGLTSATPALAHNGYGIAPTYSAPFGLLLTDGQTPLTISWTALEFHEEQFYRIKVQANDFPPTPSPPSSMRQGHELASLPSTAYDYDYELDLSSLTHGAWRIYAEFDEPPNCVELESVPALVVKRDPGQPMPFGALVTSPLEDSVFVHEEAFLEVQAVSPSPVKVTIEAGDIVRDPDFPDFQLCLEFTWAPSFTIVEQAEMQPHPDLGEGVWLYAYEWDTLNVPDGAYLLRVTVSTEEGHFERIWSRRWVNVEHPYNPNPTNPGTDTDINDTDTDTDSGTETPTKDEGGCSGGAMGLWGLLGLGMVLGRRLTSKPRF